MRRESRERGAGSVLAVSIVAAVVVLASLALPLYTVLVVRASVSGAADAAALAAADTVSGVVSGIPCERAAAVAQENGAQLDACASDGLVVTVSASRAVLGFRVVVAATAGPPGTPLD
jgi:secretion/DNA translocation related TadE-like protein